MTHKPKQVIQKSMPWAALGKVKMLDAQANAPSLGRIWELRASFRIHDTVPEIGIMTKGCLEFSYWL